MKTLLLLSLATLLYYLVLYWLHGRRKAAFAKAANQVMGSTTSANTPSAETSAIDTAVTALVEPNLAINDATIFAPIATEQPTTKVLQEIKQPISTVNEISIDADEVLIVEPVDGDIAEKLAVMDEENLQASVLEIIELQKEQPEKDRKHSQSYEVPSEKLSQTLMMVSDIDILYEADLVQLVEITARTI